MNRIIATLLVGLTLIGVGGFIILSAIRNQQTSIVSAGPQIAVHSEVSADARITQGYPTELIIPSLRIDLSIIPGEYNPKTKQWTLTLDKAQYAVMTPMPNTAEGNTFIYGHYRKEVFATLHTIKMGEIAVIKTSNGHSFYYQLAAVRTTDPADTSIFDYRGAPILTIQTCTGVFFQNRQLFTFNLVRVA